MRKLLLIAVSVLMMAACGGKDVVVKSPDSNVKVALNDSAMTISYKGSPVQVVKMALAGMPVECKIEKGLKTEYSMKSGKRLECNNSYNAAILKSGERSLQVNVSNDGVAFRFVGGAEPEITFVVPDSLNRWFQPLRKLDDFEGFYPLAVSGRKGNWAYPALVEYSDGVFGLITEADLGYGASGSHLECDGEGNYTIGYTGEPENPAVQPWRIVMVGTLAQIVESTLVTDYNMECQIEDTSWIEPGLSAWIYWAYNHSSKDYQKVIEYIDLAVEMNWPYNLIDWEWDEMANGGNIEDALKYAASKGVKANLWYNSGTSWIGNGAPGPQDRLRTAEAREKEMTRLNELGATGIKVDFFLPDNPEMVDYYLDILKDAARHHLLVDFHGCTIPRGWRRTWPNLMSMEGVYGAEWYNNNPRMTNAAPAHNATIPFTRNVIGPMDYTPCTFTDSQFKHLTTDCHELALPILFESGLQHMADRPEAYLGLPTPVRELLSGLPAAWDDTRLVAGYPGKYAVIARQKDGVWYVGGINGLTEEQTISLDLQHIGAQGKKVMLITDNGDVPGLGFNIQTDATAPSEITLPSRGGFVMTF